MRLFRFLAIALAGALSIAADAPPAKPVPPDRKAFTQARKTTDPQKKVDALRAFIQQFPKSRFVSSANEQILDTLAEKLPDRTAEIRKQAELILKEEKKSRPYIYDDVAGTLQDAGVLLDMAEDLSKKAVKGAKGKKFDDSRPEFQMTLGLIYIREGKVDQGQQVLKEALAANPNLGPAAEALGDLALKNGHDAEAFDYFVTARLTGKTKPETRKTLETLYAKQHGGSMDGFDAMLDAAYRKRSPEPMHVQPFKPDATRSDRVVLAELFTGSGCPPCAGADAALDAMMERYSRKDVTILMFHEHVPHPDPMANPDTVKRSEFYSVQGVPTLAVDGKTQLGGGPRRQAQKIYDGFNPNVEKELKAPAEAHIQLTASREGNDVKVHATVSGIKSDSKDLRLQIALVEEKLRYSGENGVRFHPLVVRALAGKDDAGFEVAADKPGEVDWTFDVSKTSADLKKYLDDYEEHNERYGKIHFIEKKDAIDPADLSVAAFVEDTKTHHVLQSANFRLAGASTEVTTR